MRISTHNQIIPVINEKSIFSVELDQEQYTFDVCAKLTKPQIKDLIEKTFQLTVVKLTTQNQPRQRKAARFNGSLGSKQKRVRVIFTKSSPLITQYFSGPL